MGFNFNAMIYYEIKRVDDLGDREIGVILKNWNVPEWMEMNATDFRQTFRHSEFHLLKNQQNDFLAVARINFDFNVKIGDNNYNFPELVGLVAIIKMKGYGKQLIDCIKENLSARKVEAIGFCEKPLRPFYEKIGVEILVGKAKWVQENIGDKWTSSTDDDILNLTLSSANVKLLEGLDKKNLAFLIS